MAAHDALQRLMGFGEGHKPLAFRTEAEEMQLDYDKENLRAEDLLQQYQLAQKQGSATWAERDGWLTSEKSKG